MGNFKIEDKQATEGAGERLTECQTRGERLSDLVVREEEV
jgi:hypothetical protein